MMECKICHVPYDEEEHRPRHAPCGHGLCTSCLRALIIDSIFVCPKCRQKNKADVPEDLPVNFDLIDVIRFFKTNKKALAKENIPQVSGASNDELCKVHHKSIEHRCLKCQMWICGDCIHSHSKSMGCSTTSSSKAMENIRNKHSEDVDKLITTFKDDANFVLSKIQEHTDERKEHLKKAEQNAEEIKKLHNLLEDGTTQKEKLIKSKNYMAATNTPYALMDAIEVLAQMKHTLRSWSVNNLGKNAPLGLLKEIKEGKGVYVTLVIKDKEMHAKLTEEHEAILMHNFQKQTVPTDSLCMPFDHLQSIIPKEANLVFIELSLDGVVKGRMYLRLCKDLPNIREYFVKIVIGQMGKSLNGIPFDYHGSDSIGSTFLNFSDMPLTIDSVKRTNSIVGDIFGEFSTGYLQYIFFYAISDNRTYGGSQRVFATIEKGFDMLLDLYNKNTKNVKISDCGLVLKEE